MAPSGAGQPAGYASSMGGSFQRYSPPASAEYLARQAELDRFEAAERMRKGVPASEPTRMQKIYNDYVAERAVTDRNRAEQRAADDAAFQRAQQARIAEDERSSNENVRKAAADAQALLEKQQAQARERAEAAERQKVANAEALQRRRDEEDRAAKLVQEKQAQERLAQEKRAQQQAASTPAPKCYSKGGPYTLRLTNTYPYVEESRQQMLRNSCAGSTVTGSSMTCSERPGMKNWRNCVVTYNCAPVPVQCGPPRKAISQ